MALCSHTIDLIRKNTRKKRCQIERFAKRDLEKEDSSRFLGSSGGKSAVIIRLLEKSDILDCKWNVLFKKSCACENVLAIFRDYLIYMCLQEFDAQQVDRLKSLGLDKFEALREEIYAYNRLHLFVRIKQCYNPALDLMLTSTLRETKICKIHKEPFFCAQESYYSSQVIVNEVNLFVIIQLANDSAEILNVFYLALYFMRMTNFFFTKRSNANLESYSFKFSVRPDLQPNASFRTNEVLGGKNDIYSQFDLNEFRFETNNTQNSIVIGLLEATDLSYVYVVPQECFEEKNGKEVLLYLYASAGNLVGLIEYKGNLSRFISSNQ